MTDADRLRAIVEDLQAAVVRLGMRASADWRVSERDAATLLCIAPGTLKSLRQDGSGPIAHRTALNGCMYSLSLRDLAEWILLGREATSDDIRRR